LLLAFGARLFAGAIREALSGGKKNLKTDGRTGEKTELGHIINRYCLYTLLMLLFKMFVVL
jgi:hypothetical protein